MSIPNRVFMLLVILAACVGCDQATKRLAEMTLKHAMPRSFLGNTLRLEYAENAGAFLGMGASWPDWQRWALLTVASSILLVGLGLFVCFKRDLRSGEIIGYALILGGGASNMVDRIVAGVVIDFMNVGIGALRTGIFNVADMVIMAGLFLVLASHLGSGRPDQVQQTATPA